MHFHKMYCIWNTFPQWYMAYECLPNSCALFFISNVAAAAAAACVGSRCFSRRMFRFLRFVIFRQLLDAASNRGVSQSASECGAGQKCCLHFETRIDDIGPLNNNNILNMCKKQPPFFGINFIFKRNILWYCFTSNETKFIVFWAEFPNQTKHLGFHFREKLVCIKPMAYSLCASRKSSLFPTEYEFIHKSILFEHLQLNEVVCVRFVFNAVLLVSSYGCEAYGKSLGFQISQ